MWSVLLKNTFTAECPVLVAVVPKKLSYDHRTLTRILSTKIDNHFLTTKCLLGTNRFYSTTLTELFHTVQHMYMKDIKKRLNTRKSWSNNHNRCCKALMFTRME